jgi:two-component system chemotaxis response regulator CheB
MIFVAPPDRHVLVNEDRLTLVDGPRENGVRPAVDPLFRSAARSFGPRAIGVILSGTMDDGTAGAAAIHAAGGATVAQEPDDAVCPGMPQSAIDSHVIDHIVPASDIGPLLLEVLRRTDVAPRPPVAQRTSTASEATDLVCPECGGVLRVFDENGIARFHCRVGHDYSPESLFSAQESKLEAGLWAAIRTLEESASMARRLGDSARKHGSPMTARRFEAREQEAAQRADLIRSAILTLTDLEATPPIGEPEPVATEDDRRRPEAHSGFGSQRNGS